MDMICKMWRNVANFLEIIDMVCKMWRNVANFLEIIDMVCKIWRNVEFRAGFFMWGNLGLECNRVAFQSQVNPARGNLEFNIIMIKYKFDMFNTFCFYIIFKIRKINNSNHKVFLFCTLLNDENYQYFHELFYDILRCYSYILKMLLRVPFAGFACK
jgi:hypothetical protein